VNDKGIERDDIDCARELYLQSKRCQRSRRIEPDGQRRKETAFDVSVNDSTDEFRTELAWAEIFHFGDQRA